MATRLRAAPASRRRRVRACAGADGPDDRRPERRQPARVRPSRAGPAPHRPGATRLGPLAGAAHPLCPDDGHAARRRGVPSARRVRRQDRPAVRGCLPAARGASPDGARPGGPRRPCREARARDRHGRQRRQHAAERSALVHRHPRRRRRQPRREPVGGARPGPVSGARAEIAATTSPIEAAARTAAGTRRARGSTVKP